MIDKKPDDNSIKFCYEKLQISVMNAVVAKTDDKLWKYFEIVYFIV